MKQIASIGLISCLSILFFCSVSAVKDDSQDKQVYVVYMGSLPSHPEYSPTSHHMSILQEVTGESSTEDRLVRSFKRSFNGFSARLTESEQKRVAGMEGIVSVFPNLNYTLQTTLSWDFMGLKEGSNTKRNPEVESNIIIGVLDTGIWPESESFSDKGFGPPPKKWKGVCDSGANFTCNNKLIGARDYTNNDGGARDYVGHGTHTSSTAAGNAIMNTSFYGLGKGTVRGGVPASRIAAYRVCDTRCLIDQILAAFDDAIADGVDLITISIGHPTQKMFAYDPIAIGAFHAMENGILTMHAAGNSGPEESTVFSVAPWVFTVAASNTNRAFFTKVVMGDGKTLTGRGVNTFDLNGTMYPVVYGKSAGNLPTCKLELAERCQCLQKSLVKGTIVLCNATQGASYDAQYYGAIGTITLQRFPDAGFVTSLPSSDLSQQDINSLISYVKSESSPVVTILKSEENIKQTAPVIASFSSRGPNPIVPDILKPDITAPGTEILAAYSPYSSPSGIPLDTRPHVNYSILFGTSMACPHVTGVAAYVKTFHPQWSPSMIKSAIMTTAWSMNASETGYTSTEFAYGAGHVDPIAAINPGLVYDLTKADYLAFLCGMNYDTTTIKLISGENVTCTRKILPRDLNYPSMSAKLSGSNHTSFTVSFNRTVTNVGTPISTYESKIVSNHGSKLDVEVSPRVLSFKKTNEMQSFTVVVSGSNLSSNLPLSANIIWSDGIHNVRSPIVIY